MSNVSTKGKVKSRKYEQEGRATETVGTVDSSGDLTRGEETGDGLAGRVENLAVLVNLESTHGVYYRIHE